MKNVLMKPTHKWMPVVDEDKCSGCGLCADACGPKCLEMQEGIALLTVPDACGSEEHCIGACAEDAIHMAWIPWTADTSRGKWRRISNPLTCIKQRKSLLTKTCEVPVADSGGATCQS